jgi:hypothetical protein
VRKHFFSVGGIAIEFYRINSDDARTRCKEFVKAFQEAIIKVRTVLGFLPCVHPLWLC